MSCAGPLAVVTISGTVIGMMCSTHRPVAPPLTRRFAGSSAMDAARPPVHPPIRSPFTWRRAPRNVPVPPVKIWICRKLQNGGLLLIPKHCLRAFRTGRHDSEIRNDAYLRQIQAVCCTCWGGDIQVKYEAGSTKPTTTTIAAN
jgi:hypothetical protein